MATKLILMMKKTKMPRPSLRTTIRTIAEAGLAIAVVLDEISTPRQRRTYLSPRRLMPEEERGTQRSSYLKTMPIETI